MAYITNTDTTVLPYNDSYMKYDDFKHQYILTKEAIKDELGVDINSFFSGDKSSQDIQARVKLNEISDDVYTYINHHTKQSERWKKEYFLAKDAELRDVILRAMLTHFRYDMKSGGLALKDQHGVDFGKGKQTMFGDVTVSRYTHSLLETKALLFSGTLQYMNKSLYRVGY